MTRSMNRWTLAGFMALAALGTMGVPVQADPPASPFAGTWSGMWIGDNGQDGTLDLTISDSGRITGRVFHTQDGEAGDVKGYVGADGKLSFVAFAPSDNHEHGNGVSLKGAAWIDGDGKFVASIAARYSGGASFVVVLEKN